MYELVVKAETLEELNAIVARLNGLSGRPAEPVESTKPAVQVKEKPKKAEKKTPEAPKQREPKDPNILKEITKEDVQKAFMDKAKPSNKAHMREILQAYGANKVSELNPMDYESVINELALVEV